MALSLPAHPHPAYETLSGLHPRPRRRPRPSWGSSHHPPATSLRSQAQPHASLSTETWSSLHLLAAFPTPWRPPPAHLGSLPDSTTGQRPPTLGGVLPCGSPAPPPESAAHGAGAVGISTQGSRLRAASLTMAPRVPRDPGPDCRSRSWFGGGPQGQGSALWSKGTWIFEDLDVRANPAVCQLPREAAPAATVGAAPCHG